MSEPLKRSRGSRRALRRVSNATIVTLVIAGLSTLGACNPLSGLSGDCATNPTSPLCEFDPMSAYTVTAEVSRSTNSRPLANATVRVADGPYADSRCTTDADGRCELLSSATFEAETQMTIEARRDAFRPGTEKLTLERYSLPMSVTVRFRLERR